MSREYYTLEEICKSQTSNIKQNEILENNGEFPIYGASGLIKKINFFKQEKEYIGVVKDGAGVGRVMLLPEKSSVIGTLHYIIPDTEKISIKYLYYAMINMKLSKYYSGATIPHIYFKEYKKEKVLKRKIEEQEKVVIRLEKVKDVLVKQQQQLDEIEKLKKFRFIELFGDPIRNEKGWEKIKIQKIVENKIENINFISSISYIDISSIDNKNNIIKSYQNFNKDEKIPIRAKKILEKKDILVSTVRPNLKNIAVYDNINTENLAVASTGFSILRAKESINHIFLFYVIKSDKFTEKLVKLTTGANYPAVSDKIIKDECIILPPLSLQQKFAGFVEEADKLKVVTECILFKLKLILLQNIVK